MYRAKLIQPPLAAISPRMCSATRLLCSRASGVGSGSAISREWKEYSGIIVGHERTAFRESCARHRRREARRSGDRQPPASRRREPDAALPGNAARGEGAARRSDRRARRLRRAAAGAVAPGASVWPEDGSWDDLTRQRIVSHTLLRRTGDPDDVARAVYYLIAEAPYVTGQIIAVDGGRSINI